MVRSGAADSGDKERPPNLEQVDVSVRVAQAEDVLSPRVLGRRLHQAVGRRQEEARRKLLLGAAPPPVRLVEQQRAA